MEQSQKTHLTAGAISKQLFLTHTIDQIDVTLLNELATFTENINRFGVGLCPYDIRSIRKLHTIPLNRKYSLIEQYQLLNSWFLRMNEDLDPEEISPELADQYLADLTLKHHKMRILEDFWRTLQKDEILEVYDKNMIQIYRNFNFYKYCSYSLLEISVTEWFELWERSEFIMKRIFSEVKPVFEKVIPVKKYDVPLHLLREKLNPSRLTDLYDPKAYEVTFCHVGSTTDSSGLRPKGGVCTSKAKEITGSATELKNLHFV